MQRPARETRQTLAALEREILALEDTTGTTTQLLSATVFWRTLQDLRDDMDRMAGAREKIRHLAWAVRVSFQPRARARYGGLRQLKIWALGDVQTVSRILHHYTKE